MAAAGAALGGVAVYYELRRKRFLDLPEGDWRAALALEGPDR